MRHVSCDGCGCTLPTYRYVILNVHHFASESHYDRDLCDDCWKIIKKRIDVPISGDELRAIRQQENES